MNREKIRSWEVWSAAAIGGEECDQIIYQLSK